VRARPGGVLYCADGSGVFSLTPPASPGGPWTDNRLFTFNPPVDGGANAVVIGSGGVLYSNTTFGGPENIGIVFSLTPPASPGGSWTENVLYNSGIGGLVIGHGGVFYGVWPGLDGIEGLNGTVLSLTPPATPGDPWTPSVIHEFPSGTGEDVYSPDDVMVAPNGMLIGAAASGGAGAGGVFLLTPPASPGGAWSEVAAHFPHNGSEGRIPSFAVLGRDVIYGSTVSGGSTDGGTVFSLVP